jgi:hypothetical protein
VKITIELVCFIVALILFAIAAASVPTGKFNAQAGGLFFLTLALTSLGD